MRGAGRGVAAAAAWNSSPVPSASSTSLAHFFLSALPGHNPYTLPMSMGWGGAEEGHGGFQNPRPQNAKAPPQTPIPCNVRRGYRWWNVFITYTFG